MSGRDVLGRQARGIRLLTISGLLVIIGALAAVIVMGTGVPSTKRLALLVMVGTAMVAFALGFAGQRALRTVRCPWCQGELGSFVDPNLSLAHVGFCPRCGKSLDDPLASESKPKTTAMLDDMV